MTKKSIAFIITLLFFCSSFLVHVQAEGMPGIYIIGDGSGGGGGGDCGDGGDGGGGNDVIDLSITDGDNVIFGDGSGGGAGGRASGSGSADGGLGGSGNDTLVGGSGNDIIFGDGFDGANAGFYPGKGGLGGGGGGAAGGGFATPPTGGTGGIGAGGGGGGTQNGNGGTTLIPGVGSSGGNAGSYCGSGGSSAADSLSVIGSGGSGYSYWGGGGGGAFGGASGGASFSDGANGDELQHQINDATGEIYAYFTEDILKNVLNSYPDYGGGDDFIDGGGGVNELFGLGGKDTFIVDSADGATRTRIWDLQVGETLMLLTGGVPITPAESSAILSGAVVGDYDNDGSIDDIRLVFNGTFIDCINITNLQSIGSTLLQTNQAPSLSIRDSELFYRLNVGYNIDSSAIINDPDGDDQWNGGTLRIQLTGADALDQLSIYSSSIEIIGTTLIYDGNNTATLSASGGTVSGSTALTITFRSNATNLIVQNVLRAIRFGTTSTDLSNRTITITAEDLNGSFVQDTRTLVPPASLIDGYVDTNGTTMILTFDKNMMSDPTTTAKEFSVMVDGSLNSATAVTNDGDDNTLELTLSTPVQCGQSVIVSYLGVSARGADGSYLSEFFNIALPNYVPISGGSITINSGDAATNHQNATLTLSVVGAVEMKISEDQSFSGVSYETYATSKAFTLSSGDGTKTVYARYKDALGNETTETVSDTILLDTRAPSGGSIIINSGDAATGNASVTLTMSAVDATAMQMMISEDSNFTDASYEVFGTSKSFTLSSGDGIKTVYVRYKDAVGNVTTETISDTILLDTTAPSGGSIAINFGDSMTDSSFVFLSLSATDATAMQMMVSEDPNFAGTSYEAYATGCVFTLSGGDATKTIYVRYKDAVGNETTETISDTILLDTTAPSGGSITINDGDAATGNATVTLSLSATDATAMKMMISEDPDFADASYETYSESKTFTLSSGDEIKTIYVRYQDELGHETTEVISDTILLDTTAPSGGSITINGGDAATGDVSVNLNFSATDATAMEMKISEDPNFADATYETYTASKAFTLSSGDGTKTVYVRYKDAVGNETTETISNEILLDMSAPSGGSVTINAGDTATDELEVLLDLSATDATAIEMMISEDPDFADASYEVYAESKAFTLSGGDGTKTVYVRYKDALGNETTETISDTILLDTIAPSGGSITINDEDAATGSATVTLSLSATDATAMEMKISEDPDFADASYETYSESKTFTLSSGDGIKTIYVRYQDVLGHETTEMISDTILLDTTAPSIGSIKINDGDTMTDNATVVLTLSATDTMAIEMMISEDPNFEDASYEAYATSKVFQLSSGDGTKTVYVRYKDAVGNQTTKMISDTILLDTTSPVGGSITINNGASAVNSKTVTLKLSATDATAMKMKISEDPDFTGVSYQAYATSKVFQLSSGDGNKTVYVRYQDEVGHETNKTISDTIFLDTKAPNSGSVTINGGDATTNDRTVTLTLFAVGSSKMMISEDSAFVGASYESYVESKTFTLSDGDGTKTVYVRYKDTAGNVTTETIRDTIELNRSGTVSGTLTDINNNPLSGVLVELHSDPRTTYTDSNGYFEFENVPYGEHTLYIIDERFASVGEIQLQSVSILHDTTQWDCTGDDLGNGMAISLDEREELQITLVAQESVAEQPESTTSWLIWLIPIGGAVLIIALIVILRKRKAGVSQ